MKRVMISELKAHLSEYVAAARRGETVIVCDRNTPVAKLEPVDDFDLGIREPKVTPEERIRILSSIKPVANVDPAVVQRIFDEQRADRF